MFRPTRWLQACPLASCASSAPRTSGPEAPLERSAGREERVVRRLCTEAAGKDEREVREAQVERLARDDELRGDQRPLRRPLAAAQVDLGGAVQATLEGDVGRRERALGLNDEDGLRRIPVAGGGRVRRVVEVARAAREV